LAPSELSWEEGKRRKWGRGEVGRFGNEWEKERGVKA